MVFPLYYICQIPSIQYYRGTMPISLTLSVCKHIEQILVFSIHVDPSVGDGFTNTSLPKTLRWTFKMVNFK